MPCQGGIFGPKDACSKVLLIINRASVYSLPRLLRPVTPLGSQPPFSVGENLHPYLHHYSRAFASSRSFTRYALPRTYAEATRSNSRWPRAYRAYHVPQVVPTNGGRVPLYTGGGDTCGGRPLISPAPAPPPILGLEPLSRLSSAGVTVRNTKASLPLPFPVIPHSRSTVRLGFSTPAVCLRPPRSQGRPHSAGTEGATSWLNHGFLATSNSTTCDLVSQ
jgi:hypothetical protein